MDLKKVVEQNILLESFRTSENKNVIYLLGKKYSFLECNSNCSSCALYGKELFPLCFECCASCHRIYGKDGVFVLNNPLK
ncbi:hypothetical protein D0T49_03060 [Paludibacter sp. 221]|uniref:hypothetical protein n=1 Tax=Paludibacter sp. 221 TaxID=2302939 RepID=UPI0013D4941E|nr:hypothetical protein [Paludibacter sp. 221]NDV46019.1 hypothetical protein [Paludibacter sp. 221]